MKVIKNRKKINKKRTAKQDKYQENLSSRKENSRNRKMKKRRKRKQQKLIQLVANVKLFILVAVVTLASLLVVASFFYSVGQVSGYGMLPTLHDKDVLLSYKTSELKRFDLIVIKNGGEKEYRRIIGLPGEIIHYENDNLYVDGQEVEEKYIISKINQSQLMGSVYTNDFNLLDIGGNVTISEKSYLVLGDNRPYTTDSRDYGLIAEEKILGVVKARLLPLDTIQLF